MNLSPYECQNTLLNTLPESDFQEIVKDCKLVHLDASEVVYESNMNIQSILFPKDCIISVVYESFEGKATEIASMGNSGAVGCEILQSKSPTKFTAITLHSGWAYQMKKSFLIEHFQRVETFRNKLLNYAINLNTQIAFTGVCNRLHTVEQQYCKFLLLCIDWIPGEITFTQGEIAHIFGVRRETITQAAFKLSNLGIIDYHRRKLHILNHQALKDLACDCYEAIKSTLKFENILSPNNSNQTSYKTKKAFSDKGSQGNEIRC